MTTLVSCDTNVLLCAVREDQSEESAKAREYLQEQAANDNFVLCELVLVELYVLLRNPAVFGRPASAEVAVEIVETLRSNPRWMVVDYPGNLMNDIWKQAKRADFPRRAIFDLRLALTLRHCGVRRFATRNRKHFEGMGFDEVFDPMA